MKKQAKQRSGVVRCQRCYKYGHYTYECQNQVAYRYRPSRTVLYKEKIQLELKNPKLPKTKIVNPDYKRRIIEDRPSSESESEAKGANNEKVKVQTKKDDEKQGEGANDQHQQLELQSSSSESSSSEDSSQSSSSSSSSSSEEGRPTKKYKKA